MRGVLPAVVGPPAARSRGAGKAGRHRTPRGSAETAALGAGAVGLLEPAFNGLGSVGHPARAAALPAGTIARRVRV